MKTNFLLLIIFLILSTACKKKEEKPELSYYKGQLTISTDDSFKSVVEALADGYMIAYPESEIKVKTQKEDLGFLDLLNDKSKIIVMSRELSPDENSEYEKRVELKYQPARFAADGVVFIVPKNSSKSEISVEEIEKGLQAESKNFIFDGTNSSNLNFIAQKLNKKPSDLKFSIINGNENVIKELNKYPDKIGVIGWNSISRPYDKKSEQLREMIKVLPVKQNGKLYDISPENLRKMTYPYTRVLYFLINESGFNLANGFVRYSCTQLGQKIVEKEGLQPYNLYGREVQMR